MPIITNSSFRPHWPLQGGHVQTIFGSFVGCQLKPPDWTGEIETADGDFIDTDLYEPSNGESNGKIAILTHGLESHSRAKYIRQMAKILISQGWAVIAWNLRSCSGRLNRAPRLYHSGASDDLECVIHWVLERRRWDSIALIGFSLGGNISLKFAGERGEKINPHIKEVVAISVPCDLSCSVAKISHPSNRVYSRRFLHSLSRRIIRKALQFPELIDISKLKLVRTIEHFDNFYTAPLHGFRSAEDYYKQSSSLQFIPKISTRSLLINAENDPFLGSNCFPVAEAEQNENFHLEIPKDGGHVGFLGGKGWIPEPWVYLRIRDFLDFK